MKEKILQKPHKEESIHAKESSRGRDFDEIRKQMLKETEEGVASENTPSLEELAEKNFAQEE